MKEKIKEVLMWVFIGLFVLMVIASALSPSEKSDAEKAEASMTKISKNKLQDMEEQIIDLEATIDMLAPGGEPFVQCDICEGYCSIDMLHCGERDIFYCGNCLAEAIIDGKDVVNYDGT